MTSPVRSRRAILATLLAILTALLAVGFVRLSLNDVDKADISFSDSDPLLPFNAVNRRVWPPGVEVYGQVSGRQDLVGRNPRELRILTTDDRLIATFPVRPRGILTNRAPNWKPIGGEFVIAPDIASAPREIKVQVVEKATGRLVTEFFEQLPLSPATDFDSVLTPYSGCDISTPGELSVKFVMKPAAGVVLRFARPLPSDVGWAGTITVRNGDHIIERASFIAHGGGAGDPATWPIRVEALNKIDRSEPGVTIEVTADPVAVLRVHSATRYVTGTCVTTLRDLFATDDGAN